MRSHDTTTVLFLGCLWPLAARADLPPTPWCEGRVVPAEEVRLTVPSLEVELAGVSLGNRALRLSELARADALLAPGAPVARFAFPERALRAAVEGRVRRLQAGMDLELTRLETRLKGLEGDLERARLAAAKAAIEVKKKSVLSRRDADLVDLQARRAAFEVKALEEQILAERKVLAAARANHEERLRQAHLMFVDLDQWKRSFELLAPAGGRLWLPPLAGRGRAVRKGDRLAAGIHFASLVVGDARVVEFLIPEKDMGSFRPDLEVRVESLPPGVVVLARLREVGVMPCALEGPPSRRAAWFQGRAALPSGERRLRLGQAVRVAP